MLCLWTHPQRRSSVRLTVWTLRLVAIVVCLAVHASGYAGDHVPFPQRPIRLVRLVTGEQFLAEWRGIDRHDVALRVSSGAFVSIPRCIVAGIANPERVVDVWDSDFEPKPPTFPPVTAGILHACRRGDAGSLSRLAIRIGDEVTTSKLLQIEITDDGDCQVAIPDDWRCQFRQRVVTRSGNDRSLSVTWSASAWSVSWGEGLVARGIKPAHTANDVTGIADVMEDWSDLVLRRNDAEPIDMHSDDPQQDGVVLDGGTVLYGRIDGVNLRGLELVVEDKTIRLPWTEFRQALFASELFAVARATPVAGVIVDWKRSAIGGLFPLPDEHLIGCLTNAREFHHPWLGTPLTINDDETLRRRYGGTWQWLWPGMLHLGDEVEPGLVPAVPQGTTWSGEWTMEGVPRGVISLSAEIADMEPSAAATPPTQPRLEELREGHWLTELWINSERMGDWNSQLSWSPGVITPERVRLPIPKSALRTGTNTWKLTQRPGPDGESYDDIWIGRLALEVETARPLESPNRAAE